jgi:C1A family cysteine protease
VDWVKEGVVTEVKNQLFCGSCWAFSTTGSIEGINALYTGKLVSLSEQELVDCDTSKDQGCSGGFMDYAFDFVIKNGGLDTEADYNYWSVGGICNKLRMDRHVVTIDGFEDVPVNDEKALQKAVAVQPVSVAICADPLQSYSSGIVDSCCKELDHGVLVVGYGEEDDVPYWLVKNSWGASWGENGYFRLKRNVGKEGMCGIAMAPSYPLKTSPNPKPDSIPEVCGWLGQTECKHGSMCTCTMDVLDLLCLSWGCKEKDDANPLVSAQ